MTNTCASRAANRLAQSERDGHSLAPVYNGVGDRVGQTADSITTTTFALWFVLWTGLAWLTGVYAGTAIPDLRKSYLLIFEKPWYGCFMWGRMKMKKVPCSLRSCGVSR